MVVAIRDAVVPLEKRMIDDDDDDGGRRMERMVMN